jgi:hypothetical protein
MEENLTALVRQLEKYRIVFWLVEKQRSRSLRNTRTMFSIRWQRSGSALIWMTG